MWAGGLSRCYDDNSQTAEKGTYALDIHNSTLVE